MRMVLLALLLIASVAGAPARAEAPPPAEPSSADTPPELRTPATPVAHHVSPVQLFAAAEAAWGAGDAEVLASLVDTTSVRIGLKPGATPTAAMTRSAAAFLFQDQLRLVTTQSFQVIRIQAGGTTSVATARWLANLGGREGVRRLTVTLNAVPIGGRWFLREVRVKG